jgi:hypothetical protein
MELKTTIKKLTTWFYWRACSEDIVSTPNASDYPVGSLHIFGNEVWKITQVTNIRGRHETPFYRVYAMMVGHDPKYHGSCCSDETEPCNFDLTGCLDGPCEWCGVDEHGYPVE